MLDISPQTKALARGNDFFRKDFKQEKIVFSEGVNNSADRNAIIEACKNFSSFHEEDDTNNEHAFGAFDIQGVTYYFKIEYWDKEFEFTADPYETSIFNRILTLMKADEY